MSKTFLDKLAFPLVVGLISFLSYCSQIFFFYIEPHALESRETAILNLLIGCIWITYFRACFTDPGSVLTYTDPKALSSEDPLRTGLRLCKKCNAPKPARAHHCKICKRQDSEVFASKLQILICKGRCIPKMDHHCPWTINCVSQRTFPHFFRFLFFAVAAMAYLEYLLSIRANFIWARRKLPSVCVKWT